MHHLYQIKRIQEASYLFRAKNKSLMPQIEYNDVSKRKIIELLKLNKLYNNKRIREPIRLKKNSANIVKDIRKKVAHDVTLQYLSNISEFNDAKYVFIYNLTSYRPYFIFDSIIDYRIEEKMSINSQTFNNYFMPKNSIDYRDFDCVFVVHRDNDEPELYTNLAVHINKNTNTIEFESLVLYKHIEYNMNNDIISDPADFFNILSKTDDFESNITEIEYYLGCNVFHKLLVLKNGEIVYPEI